MPISYNYTLLPPAAIFVDRSTRQRDRGRPSVDTSGGEWESFVSSVKLHGVLQPIIIDKEHNLIAGERRLTACTQLNISIPCRYMEDLDPFEAKLIELEENLKRRDLTWQDNAIAITEIHTLYLRKDPAWTQLRTSEVLNLDTGLISKNLRVVKEFDKEKIVSAASLSIAYNMLSRSDQRAADDAVADILEAGHEMFDTPKSPVPLIKAVGTPGGPVLRDVIKEPPTPVATRTQQPEAVICTDFLRWAPQFRGKPFNFIHCDFPYGVNVFGGPQSGRDKHTTYEDTVDIYWSLIETLCTNLDRLMAHSAHLMFWFSMDHYTETLERFRRLAPSLAFNPKPLIWHKTDNIGILPDANRGPRQVYETCLIASREDRFIVRAVSNTYGAPTAKDREPHPSAKPEPVLRQFMSMFVDENTRMLDPTCGGGTALRAAESLGAREVLGLEVNEEFANHARAKLRQFRAMRGTAR